MNPFSERERELEQTSLEQEADKPDDDDRNDDRRNISETVAVEPGPRSRPASGTGRGQN